MRLLGEDLIAFRDTNGDVGLVDAFCPHRRAPMFFGRNEECGLRCVYHGWKFDRTAPASTCRREPPDSLFKTKVRIAAYPTWEARRDGLGLHGAARAAAARARLRTAARARDAPLRLEDVRRRNWLQALEGGIDTSHSSFLHNEDIDDKKLSAQRRHRAAARGREDAATASATPGSARVGDDEDYVRVYHYVMPAQQLRGGVTDDGRRQESRPDAPRPRLGADRRRAHVDVQLALRLRSGDPARRTSTRSTTRRISGRGPDDYIPGTFKLKRNTANDYLIDRELQRTKTFTGITGINTQDFALQEGMGPICDRTNEHLGTSDRAIIAARQLLFEALEAVESGEAPRGTNPEDYKAVRPVDLQIPRGSRWQEKLEPELVARF